MTANTTPNLRANVAEFSVGELANAIKRALEDGFGFVRLRGEISGYRGPHSSGHCYFSLKDDKAKIEAVIWRGQFSKLKFRPEEGMEVIAQGRITTFPGSSKYQIVIEALEPAGVGALMALLEDRKRKLGAEGLFDEARKKALPFLPRVVGIITSPTGAVIRDMLHGFDERFPARVIVWPVRVQGETSAAEVAAAIRGFNALEADGPIPRPDILIVARGGGSLEDLWSFNEEIVVRAAAESRIPLISAVGHETDWTLIDLAADARAPTPTKAAEWAVPKYSELIQQLADLASRRAAAIRRSLESKRTELRAAARGLPRLEDLVSLPRQRFDAVEKRLGRALLANTRAHAMRHARVASRLNPRLIEVRLQRAHDRIETLGRRSGEGLARIAAQRRSRLERVSGRLNPQITQTRIARAAERLATLDRRAGQALLNRVAGWRRVVDGQGNMLASLSYQSVLRRGFALVRDEAGHAVRSAGQVAAGGLVEMEFADGRLSAQVLGKTSGGDKRPTPSPKSVAPAVKPARRSSGGSNSGPQGTLF
ncbi:MAG: exodeoxyribonuclease VII large subunit [Hyphomicrobiaceae bacterium]